MREIQEVTILYVVALHHWFYEYDGLHVFSVYENESNVYIYIEYGMDEDNSKQGYNSCASSVLTFSDIMEKGLNTIKILVDFAFLYKL